MNKCQTLCKQPAKEGRKTGRKRNGGETRRRWCLLLAEGLAVGALIHGGIGFVGANQNTIQRAVVLGIAMVGAGLDGALNTFVGIAFHHDFLLFIWCKVSMSSFYFSIRAVAFRKKICYCDKKEQTRRA